MWKYLSSCCFPVVLVWLAGIAPLRAQSEYPTDSSDSEVEMLWDKTEISSETTHSEVLAPPRERRPPPAPVQSRPIHNDTWEKAAAGIDYSRDVPKKIEPRPASDAYDTPDWMRGDGWIKTLQILAVIVAIGLIAYLIFKLLELPSNKKLASDGTVITLDNVEQYLEESDLDAFLKTALAQQNYTLAIRLYYLQLIKDLHTKKQISWSREKTNRDYLREMARHPSIAHFRYLTGVYERVWYGNQRIEVVEFRQMEAEFQKMLASPMAFPASQPPVQAA